MESILELWWQLFILVTELLPCASVVLVIICQLWHNPSSPTFSSGSIFLANVTENCGFHWPRETNCFSSVFPDATHTCIFWLAEEMETATSRRRKRGSKYEGGEAYPYKQSSPHDPSLEREVGAIHLPWIVTCSLSVVHWRHEKYCGFCANCL